MKPFTAAVTILLAIWLGHSAYHLAPLAIEGHAWNIGQATARVLLLALVVCAWRSPLVDVPAAYMLAEELQVIGCTVGFVIDPWPVLPGQTKCSEALGLPLGLAGSVATIWIGLWLLDRGNKK